MLLVRVAPHGEAGCSAPRRHADGPDAQQFAHPRGERVPVRQALAVTLPQRLLRGEPALGFRRVGIFEPAIGVGDTVPVQFLNQIKPARGGVAARE